MHCIKLIWVEPTEEIAQTLEKSMTFDGPAPKRQLYPRRPNLNLNSPTVRKNPTQTRPIPSWPSLAGALAGSSAGTRNTYLLKVLLANAKKPALQDEDSLIGAIERTAADAASFRELYKSSAAEFQDTVRYIHQTLGVCGTLCAHVCINTPLLRRRPLPI